MVARFMNDDILRLATLVIGFWAVYYLFAITKANALMDNWAKQNGFVILQKKHLWFSRAPFAASGSQLVFRVLIDDHGQKRSCWLRLGHWQRGMMRDDLAVKWDNQN
jgi:hypothetical protein